jgi:hypothetical protein
MAPFIIGEILVAPWELPNYHALPNELADKYLKELSPSAVRILIVAFRKTLGWQKQRDGISFSQFEKLTGLSSASITKGIKELEHLDLIETEKRPGQVTVFDVKFMPPVTSLKSKEGSFNNQSTTSLKSKETINTTINTSNKQNSPPKKQAALFDDLELEKPKKRGRPPEKVEGYKEFVALWYQLHKGETGSEPLFLAADGNHIKRILKAQGLEIASSKLRSYYGNSYWFTKDKNFSMGQFIHHYDEINIKVGSISKERLAALTRSMGK